MNKSRYKILRWLSPVFLLVACTTPYNPLEDYDEVKPATAIKAPEPNSVSATPAQLAQIQRGKYLVDLLGCANCHTDGALVGKPDYARRLAGSSIGIAYSNPLEEKYPGLVFPANLTPDRDTGIGAWGDDELIKMIRSGIDRHGKRQLSVMPWPTYSVITDEDARSMVAFFRSLAPIKNAVPVSVKPGVKSAAPYVHFGMYQSRQ